MSKPVTSWLKKKTKTRKSLGRGSRWQKGTLAGIQNRDVQTSDFLVPGQGSPWAGVAGRTPGCLSVSLSCTENFTQFICFGSGDSLQCIALIQF